TGAPIFDSPQHVKAMETAKKIWDTGLVSSLIAPQLWDAHKQGKILASVWPQYWDFTFLDFAPEAKQKWRVTKMPAVEKGGKRIQGLHAATLVYAKFIPAEKRDLAMKAGVYLRMTLQGCKAHMASFPGAFVSHIPSLEAMRDMDSPILIGQKTYDVFLKQMDEEKMLPRYFSSVYYDRTESEFLKNAA